MIIFIVFAFTLFLSAFFLVLRSWQMKSTAQQANSSAEWQALVLKRDEIEADNNLSDELRHTLRTEWALSAQEILAKRDAQEHVTSNAVLSNKWMSMFASLAIFITIITYGFVGSFSKEALSWPASSAKESLMASEEPMPAPHAKHPGDEEPLDERVAKLEAKLKATPNDIDGWVLLAHSRGFQRDFKGEADALEHALKLSPGHPDLMADLADTLAMINNKSLAGEPSKLIQQVLKADPAHRKGLALAATAAMQNQDAKLAIQYWQKLRATYPDQSPDVIKIDEILAELGVAPTAKEMASTQTQVEEKTSSSPSITGDVAFSNQLIQTLKQKPLPEQAVLYVFAKFVSGPPMPLAVVRIPPQSLLAGKPVAFKLDDSLAMSPTMKLSSAESVNIEARLSISGNAIKQTDDLSIIQHSVKVGQQGLHLILQ